jgi:hypothetical protein
MTFDQLMRDFSEREIAYIQAAIDVEKMRREGYDLNYQEIRSLKNNQFVEAVLSLKTRTDLSMPACKDLCEKKRDILEWNNRPRGTSWLKIENKENRGIGML